ncbi:methyltransferase [Candidatus Woesearchaeota archaeon]|nr:methyltransferase [Candidatus Woesearchaeota archaeon]
MKAFAVVDEGIEHIAALEVKELLGSDAEIQKQVILFDAPTLLDLCKLCYQNQSLTAVCHLFSFFEFSSKEELLKKLEKVDVSAFLTKGTRFAVRCYRHGDHSFTSQTIAGEAGHLFTSTKAQVQLSRPDYTIFILIVDSKCYVGLDLAGVDLGKRPYRIFTHVQSVRAPIAYAMVRLAGYTPDKSLLDPFCGGGTICIEAALLASKKPVHYFDKEAFAFHAFPCLDQAKKEEIMQQADALIIKPKVSIMGYDQLLRFTKASQKNAKIAGVEKQVMFSKLDIEWLDTKLDKKTVDCIVTYPPQIAKVTRKKIEKVYHELFYQAEFVLKQDGRMAVLTENPEQLLPLAHQFNFLVKEQCKVLQGKKELTILLFIKH